MTKNFEKGYGHGFPMDRQALDIDTALTAANVALAGRKKREAVSFASIELREANAKSGQWELAVAAAVGFCAFAAVIVAWFY